MQKQAGGLDAALRQLRLLYRLSKGVLVLVEDRVKELGRVPVTVGEEAAADSNCTSLKAKRR
ncbi:MAG TPA: hypothetical protein DDY20_01055 [Desulfobulbaceae bacterium]|nr:hypothetical protein [Desulfobulbaceae bacterium]